MFPGGTDILCPRCGFIGPAGAASSGPHDPGHGTPQQLARALTAELRASPGLSAVIDGWPAPIAHELAALCRLLEAGAGASAFYQLRDVAEVLIKLPAAILARDLTLHAPDTALTIGKQTRTIADHVRHTLLGQSPATGTWLVLLRNTAGSVYRLHREQQQTLLSTPIAGLPSD